jgi:hypothetical protein
MQVTTILLLCQFACLGAQLLSYRKYSDTGNRLSFGFMFANFAFFASYWIVKLNS